MPFKRKRPTYKKGKSITDEGYIRFTAGPHRFQLEHRIVFQQKLGRPIGDGYECHHVDHRPWNNSPSNLQELSKTNHRIVSLWLRHYGEHKRRRFVDITPQEIETYLMRRGVTIPPWLWKKWLKAHPKS